jgi:hypothetical protein
MSIPSIIVGEGNWAGKSGNLLGYAVSDVKIVPREFTVSRALNTATRVNASGNIQAVNANIPRIDYFGGQASLLVEPSAQNLMLQSETWNVSPWTATSGSQGATISGNVTASPDGTTNADKLIEAAVTGNHFCLQSLTLTSGTTYTTSFFAKASERTLGRLRMLGSAAYWDIDFDLTLGTATGGTNPFIQNYGNGWYRIGGTFTANQASNNFILSLRDASGNTSYTGNGTNGFFVYGAQIETGSVATSYIPTTTGTVTRNADAISVTGVAGLIGQTEGTIYAEVDLRVLGDGRFATLSDGTSNNRIQCRFNAAINGIDFLIVVAGSSVGFSVSNSSHPSFPVTIPAGTYKIALGYKQNDYVVAMNGVAYTPTVTTRNVPSNFSKVTIGADVSDLNQFNNRIRAASIYQTRLPNTTTDGSPSLQSITTL